MTGRRRQRGSWAIASRRVGDRILLVGVVLFAAAGERMSHAETLKLASGSTAGNTTTQVSAEFNPRLLRRFSPVRTVMARDPSSVTEELVTLGRLLFFDG